METIALLIVLVALFYLGVSVISLLIPIRKLGIPTRARAALGVLLSLVAIVAVSPFIPEDVSNSNSADSPVAAVESQQVQQAASQSEAPAGPIVSDVSFEQVNRLFGIDSNLTELQQDAMWEDFRDQCVEWTGELAHVDRGMFGGIQIGMKHLSTTFTYDVSLSAPNSQTDYFMAWQQGQSYTYQATLRSPPGGLFGRVSADWGCE